MKNRYKDLSGMRFGRLVAISPTEKRSNGGKSVVWKCLCDCGAFAEASAKLRGMWARIEPYATKYANDSTIEHADQFFSAVYGLTEDWRCKRRIGGNRMDQELEKHT